MLLRARLRDLDLTFGIEGHGATVASHRHQKHKSQQIDGAGASIASTDQQKEA